MAYSIDIAWFKVKGNKPLSDLLLTLKTLLGARHFDDEVLNQLLNFHSQSNTDQAQVTFKKTMKHSDVLNALDKALKEQWPIGDSAQLQDIQLPPSSQLGAISGTKRTVDRFLSSHNSQPVYSEPVGSSKSKRQKN